MAVILYGLLAAGGLVVVVAFGSLLTAKDTMPSDVVLGDDTAELVGGITASA